MIMQRLDTTKLPFNKARRLDLGSLRAGGATWLLSVTEDSEDAELVRRRGRWLSHRTMEIYIQEFSSIQFIHRLPEATQAKLYSWFKLSRILLCELRVWFCLGRRQGLGFLNSLWESALEAMGGTCWRKRIFSCMPQRDSSIRCARKMEGRESLSTCAIGTKAILSSTRSSFTRPPRPISHRGSFRACRNGTVAYVVQGKWRHVRV